MTVMHQGDFTKFSHLDPVAPACIYPFPPMPDAVVRENGSELKPGVQTGRFQRKKTSNAERTKQGAAGIVRSYRQDKKRA
ncbi:MULTISPECIES: hypothetical protein [Micrococcaceae]|uniref:hypothetical protein n=1 Tax=Micrococcaceae TaxID=1268 RepID=UPI0012E3AF63|nr:hypothetical protein [Arthrobacter sp. Soil764]